MNWTLEVVVVPVADVDRAKAFYADRVGFHVDHDTTISDETRIVQLTPPGSGCSIVVAKGMVDMAPGSLRGLQLVVSDIRAAISPTTNSTEKDVPLQRAIPAKFRTWPVFGHSSQMYCPVAKALTSPSPGA